MSIHVKFGDWRARLWAFPGNETKLHKYDEADPYTLSGSEERDEGDRR